MDIQYNEQASMRKKSELAFNIAQVPLDFLMITGAFVLAYIIRVKIDGRPVTDPIRAVLFLKIILFIIPVWLLIFSLSGLYNLSSQRGRLAEIGKVFVAVSGGTMFMILVDFMFRQPIFPSKAVPVFGYMLSFLLVASGRQIMRKLQRFLFNFGVGVRRVLLVGSGPISRRILNDLRPTESGYKVVAVLDGDKPASSKFDGLKTYKSFNEAIKSNRNIDEIIQADSSFEAEEVLEMISYATNHHLSYRFVPNQFGLYALNASVGTLAGVPVMEIRHTPLDGWGRIVKRGFDLLGSTLGLVLLSPIFAIFALIIKLTDKGPVLYRHERLSRIGKKVRIYKFRSMYTQYSTHNGKSEEKVFKQMGRPELAKEFVEHRKVKNDPRVTSFGRFLRRSSLDELAQLINVFKGELSLVGPRPIVKEELERYGRDQAAFLALKPGMTGLWQISGRSDIGYEDRVKLDIYYVENWSLLLDLKILSKTALAVIRGKGAY